LAGPRRRGGKGEGRGREGGGKGGKMGKGRGRRRGLGGDLKQGGRSQRGDLSKELGIAAWDGVVRAVKEPRIDQ